MSSSINSVYNNTIWALSNHSNRLMELQEQASTGLKVNRPSDAPSSANRILNIKSELRSMDTELSSIGEITSRLEMSSSVVQSMTSQMGGMRARITSVLSGLQAGTTAASTRKAVGDEFNDMIEQYLSLANSSKAGQYLFGGAASSKPPYVVERDIHGDITSVKYVGSHDDRHVKVAAGVEMPSCLVGDDIFKFDSREPPKFLGTTGAVAGTGTSTIRGSKWLEVSASGGGWDLSIDGGLSSVHVPPAGPNTMVTDSKTGEVLYVDSTGITNAGLEAVTVNGTYDVFNALIATRDLLRGTKPISDDDYRELLSQSSASLNEVDHGLTRAFTSIGGRLEALSNLKDSIEDVQVSVEGERSRLQDADIAQISVDIAERTTLYQMSMSVAAKVFGLSILDYI